MDPSNGRTDSPMRLLIPLTLAATLLWPDRCPAQVPTAAGAKLQIDYDPADTLGAVPQATLANLLYPPAKGPVADGYPAEALPVFVTVRGGNSNLLQPGVIGESPSDAMMSDLGLLVIQMDHPVIQPGGDYNDSLVGVRRAIQYLRANAASLNIDPARIVMHSRSLGTLLAYGACLKEDAIAPLSPDPVERESSRPDYLAARIGFSSFMCFELEQGPWTSTLSLAVFPNQSFGDSTPEQRLADSPIWWLLNPGLYGRDRTPPMTVVFDSAHGDICGSVINAHSGFLGEEMLRALDEFAAQSGDEVLRQRCGSIDKVVWPDVEQPIADWTLERLAEDFGGLYLSTPVGALTASGGTLTLRAHGAEPGATVEFRSGGGWTTAAPTGCPQVAGSFSSPIVLGTAVADASGLAQIAHAVVPAELGGVLEYRALSPANCEASGRTAHLLIVGAQQ